MAIQVKAMNFLRNMCEGTAVEVSIVMDWVEVGTPFTVLGVVAEALHASSPSAVLQHALVRFFSPQLAHYILCILRLDPCLIQHFQWTFWHRAGTPQ